MLVVGTDVHLLAKRRSSLPWHSPPTVTVSCTHLGWLVHPVWGLRNSGMSGVRSLGSGRLSSSFLGTSEKALPPAAPSIPHPSPGQEKTRQHQPHMRVCLFWLVLVSATGQLAVQGEIKSSAHVACVGLNSTALPRTEKGQRVPPRLSWALRLLDNKIKGKS